MKYTSQCFSNIGSIFHMGPFYLIRNFINFLLNKSLPGRMRTCTIGKYLPLAERARRESLPRQTLCSIQCMNEAVSLFILDIFGII